ncbi:MAG: hypothetical protein IKA87_03140, partial [Lentisphaeria bacterium]|nr:hypothetical protein [Lentisphaeria bacterium]
RFLYFYLNFYIFSKVTWNNKADYNAMIDEHHKLMFGKAYPVMKKVFDRFEHIWLKQIYGRTEDTPLGPVVAIPSDHDLWHKVYSPKVIAEITADFNKAAAMVEKGSLEAKRIALFRREYLDNLAQAARDYLARTSAVKGVQMRLDGTPIHLIPLVTRKKDNSIMVDTAVSARMNDKTLDFTFVCEEPLAGQNVAVERKHDDKGMWRDDSVEIFLNPSGDKKTYYQLIINSKGCITDYKWFKAGQSAKADKSWSSGAKVNIAPVKGGFKVAVSIPLKSLPGLKKTGFPVNFGRSRILASQGKNHIHYKWSRYAKGFHDLENFGMLVPCKKEIVNDPGFDIVRQSRKDSRFWNDPRDKKARSWYSSKLKADDYAALDNKEYFSAPCSMKLVSTSIKGRSIGQYITGKLKPNTTYRVSFKIKMQNVVKMRNSASGVCLNIWDDANRWFPKGRWLTGTMDWTYMSFLHKTSAKVDKAKNSYVHLRMMGCTGTVWVDDISIEEVE